MPILSWASQRVAAATPEDENNSHPVNYWLTAALRLGELSTGGVGNMPDAEHKSSVEEYRSHAEMLRALARQTRFPDSRARLIVLADSFDRLADRVETWETIPRAAD